MHGKSYTVLALVVLVEDDQHYICVSTIGELVGRSRAETNLNEINFIF
jgi:hypothetical protein